MTRIQDIAPYLDRANHWVVKIGSAVFLRDATQVDRPTFASLVADLAGLVQRGIRITVVTSGAVALGRQGLGMVPDGSVHVPRLQALAALGQSRLIQMYETEFAHYGQKVAQILFTRADLDDRRRFLNARMALDMVHELGAIPIINENDSVATDELRFGDNDQLAAMTCGLLGAQLLVILSDVAGIYEVAVDATSGERRFVDRISQIEAASARLDEIAGPPVSRVGTGGMHSKVRAARIAARFGAATVIAPGKVGGVLKHIAQGDDVGTLLRPQARQVLAGKRAWLGAGARPVGVLRCDEGARRAVVESGASLLAKGVREVDGEFPEGSVVELAGPDGRPFARGLCIYSAPDVRRLAGHRSDEIQGILGFKILDEVVHRDNLVIL